MVGLRGRQGVLDVPSGSCGLVVRPGCRLRGRRKQEGSEQGQEPVQRLSPSPGPFFGILSEAALTRRIRPPAALDIFYFCACKALRARKIPLRMPSGGIMRTTRTIVALAAVAACSLAQSAWCQTAADCDHLANLKLPDTAGLSVSVVEAGKFTPPPPPIPPPAAETDQEAKDQAAAKIALTDMIAKLPQFCRVQGVIKPAVQFEVWLPLKDWNGKFQGTGNGGYNGAIVYTALAAGLQQNFATANTDMGHAATTPDPASWALHHPELVIDQGYRAQHETAVKAKAIVAAFYAKPPSRSYFVGCSSGGWEALTEAHRYPHDYDGIIAGAPASEVVHLHAGQIWGYLAAQQISRDKVPLISAAVIAKCDAR